MMGAFRLFSCRPLQRLHDASEVGTVPGLEVRFILAPPLSQAEPLTLGCRLSLPLAPIRGLLVMALIFTKPPHHPSHGDPATLSYIRWRASGVTS